MIPIAVHAGNPGPTTGAGNWTWLIRGRVPTLIDAGTGEPRHIEALEDALAGAPLAQVLVTHGHNDHAGGAPALAERMPQLRFRKMPWPERDAKWPVDWQPLADGDRLEAGETSLVVVHTPGHAPDHLCFWHEDTRTIFGGDLVVKGSSVWIPSSLQGDLCAYLQSLERVIALAPARILPAHGSVIDDPLPLLRSYIEHRYEREAQILEALSSGEMTADELVVRIYPRLEPPIVRLAGESVLAHLIKLERDGRVRSDAGAWHIIEP